ncbi:hypothetical protein E7T09_06445 [Deinococcus sp. KSM4-11]|uniref:Imm32 family immunity protein n=1 Tax=Deinococcus sp. KSM4-11 TaxID=2568654 RepID=UPI0010A58189|nr:hypothetical protein [Deinococcus sp. KSM4-11]THF88808.1 hypothetical protein E7T09_06445 [Deinococcus sp. KSM4-11]
MPRLILDVPDYIRGLHAEWDEGFEISVHIRDDEVIVWANDAGLRSLARLLLGLTVDSVPDSAHWHLDDLNSLKDGSTPLTIGKLI